MDGAQRRDMRAGIQRLAAIVAADFGRDPMDGALYCFASRDREKAKLLRFDVNGWCLYCVRLAARLCILIVGLGVALREGVRQST